MTEGLLYEPRSFWSIANVDPDQATFPRTIRLPREHFFNGERWPIQVKRIAIAAINYGFIEPPGALAAGGNPTGYHEGSNNVSVVELAVSAPQKFHFGTKRFSLGAALTPRARSSPRPRRGSGAPAVVGSRLSSLWGVSMLKLDRPLILPKDGTIEWDLSTHTPWATEPNPPVGAGGDEMSALAPGLRFPQATLLYQEQGAGIWPGSARANPPPGRLPVGDPLSFRSGFTIIPLARSRTVAIPPNPLPELWPYPADATFDPAVAIESPVTAFWSNNPFPLRFDGQEFDAQESTRSGSTMITDLRCHIDQRHYDRAMQVAFGSPNQPSPLSLRTGTRIRLVNGGTKAWWWRPGAPLALVFDQMTPATVYELPEPFTLGPEDHLEIEVTVPGAFPEAEPPNRQPTAYHLGVALNGYAAIEG